MEIISPRPGDHAVVRESDPPGLYELKDGLQPGELVRLESFDRGWWQVKRESDGLKTKIFLVNIERVIGDQAAC